MPYPHQLVNHSDVQLSLCADPCRATTNLFGHRPRVQGAAGRSLQLGQQLAAALGVACDLGPEACPSGPAWRSVARPALVQLERLEQGRLLLGACRMPSSTPWWRGSWSAARRAGSRTTGTPLISSRFMPRTSRSSRIRSSWVRSSCGVAPLAATGVERRASAVRAPRSSASVRGDTPAVAAASLMQMPHSASTAVSTPRVYATVPVNVGSACLRLSVRVGHLSPPAAVRSRRWPLGPTPRPALLVRGHGPPALRSGTSRRGGGRPPHRARRRRRRRRRPRSSRRRTARR